MDGDHGTSNTLHRGSYRGPCPFWACSRLTLLHIHLFRPHQRSLRRIDHLYHRPPPVETARQRSRLCRTSVGVVVMQPFGSRDSQATRTLTATRNHPIFGCLVAPLRNTSRRLANPHRLSHCFAPIRRANLAKPGLCRFSLRDRWRTSAHNTSWLLPQAFSKI
jgi:hypothetical protein